MSSSVYVVRGAIDPLLGYLSSAIRDEAQLLGGLRGDAQFIKDEMESMSGFLHYLAEAGKDQEHDHQVRAWMKQVRDLAYDTQDCIDLYARRVPPRPRGAWRHVLRVPFFLRTIPARHQAATRMRELKARARDVGERRQRYGVMVPPRATDDLAGRSGGDAANEMDAYRRGLVDVGPDTLNKDGVKELIRWLKKEEDSRRQGRGREETHASDASGRPIVLAVVARDEVDGLELVKEVYQHYSLPSLFDYKAWVTIQRPPWLGQILFDMSHRIEKLLPTQQDILEEGDMLEARDEQQPDEKRLRECVKGKRLLAVVEDVEYPYSWDGIKNILDSSGCSPGSAIIVTTKDGELAKKCSPSKTKIHSLVQLCIDKASKLIPREDYEYDLKRKTIRLILKKCNPDLFCMKLLLRALCSDPNTSRKQLEDLCKGLDSQGRPAGSAKKHILLKMMKFGYDKLPKVYKRCLLYLSISPPDFKIRRTSLVRRWVAEGHVAERDGQGALDRADRCFDELVAQGFVTVVGADNVGNVIRCKVQDFVRDFITGIARDENFGDAGLPPNLARHLSISSGIQWQHDPRKEKQHRCWSTCSCVPPPEENGALDDIIPFLESLPAFSRVGRVKIMDLDYCKELKNHHLKTICNNLFMLKYLSLRETKVSSLPCEIKKLQQLETLDIRETKVPSSATKDLMLPMLKHLLAGPVVYRVDVNTEEPLSTVQMPRKIGSMTNMETLWHVEVLEDDAEFQKVKNLNRLRDLGLVIHGKQDNIDRFLRVVVELSGCLRDLSTVWIKPPSEGSNGGDLRMNLDHSLSPPKYLEKLSIQGITSGLPNWIERLENLEEITLCETSLSYDSLRTLGKLEGLRCLTLRQGSYNEEDLTFKANEFKNIKFLVLQGASGIIRIIFETDAAPKLEKVVWIFDNMDISTDTISGINHLTSLKEFELKGRCNPHHGPVQQAVAAHQNLPVFRHSSVRVVSIEEQRLRLLVIARARALGRTSRRAATDSSCLVCALVLSCLLGHG